MLKKFRDLAFTVNNSVYALVGLTHIQPNISKWMEKILPRKEWCDLNMTEQRMLLNMESSNNPAAFVVIHLNLCGSRTISWR